MTTTLTVQEHFCQQYWRFSCELYANSTVASACLRLQDFHSTNVNVVLFECFLIRCGFTLEFEELNQVLLAIAREDYELKVFRDARIEAKPVASDPVKDKIYALMKASELQLEKQQQKAIVEAWWRSVEQLSHYSRKLSYEIRELLEQTPEVQEASDEYITDVAEASLYSYLITNIEKQNADAILSDFQLIHDHSININPISAFADS